MNLCAASRVNYELLVNETVVKFEVLRLPDCGELVRTHSYTSPWEKMAGFVGWGECSGLAEMHRVVIKP